MDTVRKKILPFLQLDEFNGSKSADNVAVTLSSLSPKPASYRSDISYLLYYNIVPSTCSPFTALRKSNLKYRTHPDYPRSPHSSDHLWIVCVCYTNTVPRCTRIHRVKDQANTTALGGAVAEIAVVSLQQTVSRS